MLALLTSYEKDDRLLRLGKLLMGEGWDLLGSAGTSRFLNENSVACRDVAEIVGKPILGHRVVTLSRELHAALLSRPEDGDELARLRIEPIDLVYVTLYPLEKTIKRGASAAEVLEQTDIGGPTLLRAAAKGRRIALSSPDQIDEFEKRLSSESLDDQYRVALAAAAERAVARYVAKSADYWERQTR
ncbi:hypothetical protein HY417_00555 [Candidatus Kaiserbacteria bacterium]|nr:hypothetical protein [Candidatus Kaiserbacteria bacterium]